MVSLRFEPEKHIRYYYLYIGTYTFDVGDLPLPATPLTNRTTPWISAAHSILTLRIGAALWLSRSNVPARAPR